MSETRRFPRYLDAPMIIMWFESDTFAVGASLIAVAASSHWSLFFPAILGMWAYAKAKKKMNRGLLKQMWYLSGLQEIKGYPGYFERRFRE